MGNREIFDGLVDEIFERRWFTNRGQVLRDFEQRIAQHLGVKHCIAVCNATAGLQVATRALDLTGEVIVPAFTFVATAHAISWSRLTPVFADVNIDTHCLCPESVRSLISEKTSAILGVHLWGHPCYVKQLQQIADEFNLKLIFDAAHAFHNIHDGTPIGSFGDCEVFSFHATKFFNTFEGGAITTNDDDLADRIQKMCNFGIRGPEDVACVGTNAKMSEINAAMGVSMFDCIEAIANTNQENFEIYDAFLGSLPGLKLYQLETLDRSNWQYVVVDVDASRFGCSRDQIVETLNANDVFAKKYFFPGCHRMPPYQADFLSQNRTLPNTDLLCQRTFCLPTGTAIEIDEIHCICEIISGLRRSSQTPIPRSRATNNNRIAIG